jgi:hypothetical protein
VLTAAPYPRCRAAGKVATPTHFGSAEGGLERAAGDDAGDRIASDGLRLVPGSQISRDHIQLIGRDRSTAASRSAGPGKPVVVPALPNPTWPPRRSVRNPRRMWRRRIQECRAVGRAG